MTDPLHDPYAPPPAAAPAQPHPQQPYPQQPYAQQPYAQYGPPAPRRSTGRVVAVVVGAVVLVLVLVLGGLALLGARAIETQQARGDAVAVEAALRAAAIAEETYAVELDGSYTTSVADLLETGALVPDPDVELTIVRADTDPRGERGYCLSARHTDGGPTLWFDSTGGVLGETPCD